MPPPPRAFALTSDARLVLGADGLWLRRSRPDVDLGGPWSDLYAASVRPVDGVPLVSLTFVDGLQALAGERSPATATRFHLPPSADHALESLIEAIERFRRLHGPSGTETGARP